MLTSATKKKTMVQGRVSLDRRTRTYLKKKKQVTLKKTKHATNFSFKLLNDFLKFVDLVKKGAMGNTRLLLIYYQ